MEGVNDVHLRLKELLFQYFDEPNDKAIREIIKIIQLFKNPDQMAPKSMCRYFDLINMFGQKSDQLILAKFHNAIFSEITQQFAGCLCALVNLESVNYKYLQEICNIWWKYLELVPNQFKWDVVQRNMKLFRAFANILTTVGHYLVQAKCVQIIFNYAGTEELTRNIFTETKLENVLNFGTNTGLDETTLNSKTRLFLNHLNFHTKKENTKVVSVLANDIILLDHTAEKPMNSEFWLDLNKSTDSVSFYVNNSTFFNNDNNSTILFLEFYLNQIINVSYEISQSSEIIIKIELQPNAIFDITRRKYNFSSITLKFLRTSAAAVAFFKQIYFKFDLMTDENSPFGGPSKLIIVFDYLSLSNADNCSSRVKESHKVLAEPSFTKNATTTSGTSIDEYIDILDSSSSKPLTEKFKYLSTNKKQNMTENLIEPSSNKEDEDDVMIETLTINDKDETLQKPEKRNITTNASTNKNVDTSLNKDNCDTAIGMIETLIINDEDENLQIPKKITSNNLDLNKKTEIKSKIVKDAVSNAQQNTVKKSKAIQKPLKSISDKIKQNVKRAIIKKPEIVQNKLIIESDQNSSSNFEKMFVLKPQNDGIIPKTFQDILREYRAKKMAANASVDANQLIPIQQNILADDDELDSDDEPIARKFKEIISKKLKINTTEQASKVIQSSHQNDHTIADLIDEPRYAQQKHTTEELHQKCNDTNSKQMEILQNNEPSTSCGNLITNFWQSINQIKCDDIVPQDFQLKLNEMQETFIKNISEKLIIHQKIKDKINKDVAEQKVAIQGMLQNMETISKISRIQQKNYEELQSKKLALLNKYRQLFNDESVYAKISASIPVEISREIWQKYTDRLLENIMDTFKTEAKFD